MEVGTTIGQYRITGPELPLSLGRAWPGVHPVIEKQVTLIAITPPDGDMDAIATQLKQQLHEPASKQAGSGLLTVFDLLEHEGDLVLVCEAGVVGDLAQELPGSGVPFEQAQTDIGTMVAAVDAYHRQHAVHGSPDPASFLRMESGALALAPFSLIRAVASLPGGGAPERLHHLMTLHHPRHWPREHASGALGAEARSDSYQMAVGIYELLTGRPAFGTAEDLPLAVLSKVATAEVDPSPLAGLPPFFVDPLQRCLSADATSRVGPAELQTALRQGPANLHGPAPVPVPVPAYGPPPELLMPAYGPPQPHPPVPDIRELTEPMMVAYGPPPHLYIDGPGGRGTRRVVLIVAAVLAVMAIGGYFIWSAM